MMSTTECHSNVNGRPPTEIVDVSVTEPLFSIRLRGIHQPARFARLISLSSPLAAIQTALRINDFTEPEPVLEWDGIDRLAALDADFHALPLEERPTEQELIALVNQVHPQPWIHWRTHGRGLRLIYSGHAGLTAEELAACAAVSLKSLSPVAASEILQHTRHPAYSRPGYPDAGPVVERDATVELGEIERWLGREVDRALIDDWLAERGLAADRQHSHTLCPVAPELPSHGEPVAVFDEGVFCHKCQADGIHLGGNRPGWFPYPLLLQGGTSSKLLTAVRGWCHWEHAQHIMDEQLGLRGRMAELCYSATLKMVNGVDDPRVIEAMRRGVGLVRGDGVWRNCDSSRIQKGEGLNRRLAFLPAVKYLRQDREGGISLAIDPEKMGTFQCLDDLSRFGYPRIRPVRGMRISAQWRPPQDPCVVTAVMLPEFLRSDAMRPFQPKYIARQSRLPIDQAEAIVSRSFPGINHAYLNLLIAARGCAEMGTGQPPMIAVHGPSGSAKTMTVAVAAAIIGDSTRDVPWTRDSKEFRTALFEAGECAGLVTCDEIVKLAHGAHRDPRCALDPLLSYRPGGTVRVLYVGPTPIDKVPVIVITDIAYPDSIRNDAQIGRRFIDVHLQRRLEWQESVGRGIDRWRTTSVENANAANAIVSAVIDEFFASSEAPVFSEIARSLGFRTMEEAGDPDYQPEYDLQQFFDACCDPSAPNAPPSTWRGRGWKIAISGGNDLVSAAWSRVCDDLAEGWTRSRRCDEVDWARVLHFADTVNCDIRPHGRQVGIRFRMGDPRSPSSLYNEQIRARSETNVGESRADNSVEFVL